jgi:hypothetical protein
MKVLAPVDSQPSGTLMFSWILSDRSFWTATLGLVQNLLRASRSQDRPTIKMFWIGQRLSDLLSDLRKGESNPRKHESCPETLDFLRLVDSDEPAAQACRQAPAGVAATAIVSESTIS